MSHGNGASQPLPLLVGQERRIGGEDGTDLVEPFAAPLCRMLARVPVEDGEVALAVDASERVRERVRVLHRPAALAVPVLGHADDKGFAGRVRRWGVPVGRLRTHVSTSIPPTKRSGKERNARQR